MAEATTYSARWIFPVDQPPIEHGTITICEDRITAVEPPGTRTPDADLGNAAILPGFVNAHTHLDLTGARGLRASRVSGGSSEDFTHWLRRVIAFRRSRSPDQVRDDIATGIAEALRAGTTLIGDITASVSSGHALSMASCRSLVFHELLGLSDAGAEQAAYLYQSLLTAPTSTVSDTRIGFSPHAPYSVGVRLFELAARQPHPVATHLAESQEELALLQSLSGPFVEFLQELKVWDPDNLIAAPLDVLRLLPRGIFVHCNYLDPATEFLPMQSVVFCPHTHAAFGHPRHPFPEFLKRGVRVALGTDSLASNPDLDILAEARFIRQHYPDVAPATILRMLTLSGAEALGFGAIAGSLTPGKSADLVELPLTDEDERDPHDLVLQSTTQVMRVMFRGQWTH